MVQVKKIFKVFRCSGQQRVQLAAFMFRSVTDTLWHTVESSFAYMADDIVWDRFTVAIKKKFIPDHIGV